MSIFLPPKALPKGHRVSLAAALSWLCFECALELPELLQRAKRKRLLDHRLRDALTAEWQYLLDFACAGHANIRARKDQIHEEISLAEHELRNCPYVGWWDGDEHVRIEPFPFTFSGGFKSRLARDLTGFERPEIRRKDVLSYKRVRVRRQNRVDQTAAWKAAKSWLKVWLPKQEPMPGWKIHVVRHMVQRFEITHARAEDLWSEMTKAPELKWPVHGAPTKLQRDKLRSILVDERVFR